MFFPFRLFLTNLKLTQSISALFIISDSLPIQNKQNKICVYLRCPMGTFALSSQLKKTIIKPFRLFSKNSVHLDGIFLLFTVSSVFYIMNFTSIFNVNDHAVLTYSGCKLQLRPECFWRNQCICCAFFDSFFHQVWRQE